MSWPRASASLVQLGRDRKRWQRQPLTVPWVRDVLRRDPCAYCGGPSGTADHIEPGVDGGSGGAENLTAACKRCNNEKGELPLLRYLHFRAIGVFDR